MPLDKQRAQHYLKAFDFNHLFVEELGWDRIRGYPLTIDIDGQAYTLRALAEKHGVMVYVCDPDQDGAVPEHSRRMKIDKEVLKHAHEHFIIYTDHAKVHQFWQWVRREEGRPATPRGESYNIRQSGERLIHKLEHIHFSVEEEEKLATMKVVGRVRQAFDVDRVTKRFFDRFKVEHAAFLTFIQGIVPDTDREWYASLMLNRLMFVYFIQKKRFLADDPNYLPNRLRKIREGKSTNTFFSFYRHFLLRLFHEGLGKQEHSPELEALLGKVPYLNGGLFDVHELERDNTDIQIADEAFERVFAFFDAYDWYLDDRPLRSDREINPDVLGYIFEKYINQKQMGAYYTKEDITEYIAKNTIIPFLFEAAENKCEIAFRSDSALWRLLREDPDRYIYEAVQREDYLPTETEREFTARRKRYAEVRAKLAAGEITSINDLITYNLNMRQFALDVIENCEGPDLLRAFYTSIEQVTVLDPTCGSGAFLFAALNILKLLYEACLDRMQLMVEDRERLEELAMQDGHRGHMRVRPAFPDFRKTLAQIEQHPNRDYFILKSIIVNNLYGVDIMEEATEICKLRLFLKLVAQIEHFKDIEPLPDIDFNIRPGNTLVGFATYNEVRKAVLGDQQRKMDFDNVLGRIEQKAQEVERGFDDFRSLQTQWDIPGEVIAESKQQLRQKLDALRAELDGYLAGEYSIDQRNIARKEEYEQKFAQWRQSHQPFHWFVEFYGILKSGGFDVIIGNPPYVEYSKVRKDYTVRGYQTESCGNLFAFLAEQAIKLLQSLGHLGVIIPVASVCTDGYLPLQRLLSNVGNLTISSFNDRPSKLFDGLEHIRLAIILCAKTNAALHQIFTTKYNKWHAIERPNLFDRIMYLETTNFIKDGSIPKLWSEVERNILKKISSQIKTLESYAQNTGAYCIYYTRKLSGFVQILDFVPAIYDEKGNKRNPSELKAIIFDSKEARDTFLVLLNSSLFYWQLTIYSDCRNLNKREVYSVRFDIESTSTANVRQLSTLANKLMQDFTSHSQMVEMKYENLGKMTIQCIYPRLSKPIIDEIDRVLAQHYGFTDEELDFIINYDIKYRMGRNGEEEEGE